MTCCASPLIVDAAVHKTETATWKNLLEEFRDGARLLEDGKASYLLSAPAIHCGNCIATIERNVATLPGVVSVRANLSLKRVSLTLDSKDRSPEAVVAKLRELGFPPQSLATEDADRMDPVFRQLLWALAVSGFAAANIMLLSIPVWNGASGATRELFQFISALIAIPAVAIGGLPFFRSALSALRHRRVNMDVPISLGVLLATGMSLFESFIGGGHAYFDAATSLLFFLLIGRTLDHMMRAKARAAAESLLRMAGKGGFVVQENGETIYLPLAALQPGMRIRVAVGERLPVDGTVLEGTTDLDRSIVTGESDPVRARPGDGVEAGALNLTGSIDLYATRTADQSFMAEVAAMMAAAEKGRSAYVRIADRLTRIYAPFVHIAAATTFVGWLLWTSGDIHQSLTVAVAVLIITCPCALGLAVPVAQVISAGQLFQAGILMKDGSALERLATITDVALDKTGTLTSGTPEIASTTLSTPLEKSLARALAQRSIHPASRALAKYLANAPTQAVNNLHEVPGHGVEATYADKRIRLGRCEWVAEIAASPQAATGTCFTIEQDPLRRIAVRETLRTGAAATVTQLQKRGIGTRIVSGDANAPVTVIAAQLHITNFAARLKPGEKLEALRSAAAAGQRTLMVGDGLNDAPALAAAHVSMAPGSAADIGRTAADFVFTRDNLHAIIFAHDVARATDHIIRQNFALAIVYNIFAVPLAILGQLNPLLAAIAMSTSSIIVVGNSLRLYRLRETKPLPESIP
jgi:P-type Cu2+ transporter